MEHLYAGGCVRTNISLDYKKIGKRLGRALRPWQIGGLSAGDDPKTIPTGDKRGHGKRRTYVILDEALNWFQSEGKTKDERKVQWGEWLRQSDKLGQDVFFIAQNFERSAKWIRELAQTSIEIVPLGNVKFLWLFPLGTLVPYLKGVYARVSRDVRSGEVFQIRFFHRSKYVWDMYDTAETFGFTAVGSAYGDDLYPPFKLGARPLWLSLILLIVTCVFYGKVPSTF